MKFMMVFEGIDRASKIMNKIMAVEAKTSKAMQTGSAGAEKAAKAAATATAGHTGALSKLQAAAQKAYAMVQAGATKAARAIETLHHKTVALGKAGLRQIGTGAGKVFNGLTIAAGAAVAAFGAASLAAGKLVGVASQFEKFQTILETTEGSSGKAKKAMGWVSDFAVKTPYELDQVMASFVALRTRGLDPTNGLLLSLGDTSAALGVPLMQGVEAMADAVTGENERLKEFGIVAEKTGNKIFYNYTNAAGEQMRAMVKANDRMAIQMKLMEIFSEKYGGAMDKLSNTWDGMIANFGDLWSGFQLSIMNAGLFDWMKGKLQGVLDTVNKMKADGTLDQWASRISSNIIRVLNAAWTFGQRVWQVLEKLAVYLKAAATYVGGWENLAMVLAGIAFAPTLISTAAGIVQIAMGLSMLGAALMANPIILGIAAIVAGAVLIYTKWEPIKAFFVDTWNAIAGAAQRAWDKIKSWIGFDPMPVLSGIWNAHKILGAMALDALPGLVENAWNTVKSLFDWSPSQAMSKAWTGITRVSEAAINGVFAAVDAVWQRVKNLFDWSPVEAIKKAWAGISDAVGEMIDGAFARASNAWDKVKSIFTFGESEGAAASVTVTDPDKILAAAKATATLKADMEAVAAINTMPAMNKLTALEEAAKRIAPAITAAIRQAEAILANVSFYNQGAALMDTMAAGIRARAAVVVQEVQRVTQMMRDHLPSSPAKVGPLSDIHRLKFGETIAASIRAEPMVKAMRAAALATMGAATLTAPAMADGAVGRAGVVAASGQADAARAEVARIAVQSSGASSKSSGGAMPPINFNPKIEIIASGNTADIERQVDAALTKASRKLFDLWHEEERRRRRTST